MDYDLTPVGRLALTVQTPQWVALNHFLRIVCGIMVKGNGLAEVADEL